MRCWSHCRRRKTDGERNSRQCLLAPRRVERLQEVLFGRRDAVRRSFAKQDFALDAQQFGKGPALFVTFRNVECLVDDRRSLRDFPRAAPGVGEMAHEARGAHVKVVLGNQVERARNELRPGDDIPLSDEQDTLPATTPRFPRPQRIAWSLFEQHRQEALCSRQVAILESNRARRMRERIGARSCYQRRGLLASASAMRMA